MFNLLVLLLLPTLTKCSTITFGSSVKLVNAHYTNSRLHSHEIVYGTGSGQQSVTAIDKPDDHGSYWQILGQNETERGRKVQCGDIVRLLHLNTQKFLHTHHFESPLSRQQEVSAFGQNQVGDHLDLWKVECLSKWLSDQEIKLVHQETGVYLHVSGMGYGGRLPGQMEVVGSKNRGKASSWKVAECVLIEPDDEKRTTPKIEL